MTFNDLGPIVGALRPECLSGPWSATEQRSCRHRAKSDWTSLLKLDLLKIDSPKTGLRKSRYEGTNRGTKGTVVNQTLLLLPRFPYKNIIIARYLDFRI